MFIIAICTWTCTVYRGIGVVSNNGTVMAIWQSWHQHCRRWNEICKISKHHSTLRNHSHIRKALPSMFEKLLNKINFHFLAKPLSRINDPTVKKMLQAKVQIPKSQKSGFNCALSIVEYLKIWRNLSACRPPQWVYLS